VKSVIQVDQIKKQPVVDQPDYKVSAVVRYLEQRLTEARDIMSGDLKPANLDTLHLLFNPEQSDYFFGRSVFDQRRFFKGERFYQVVTAVIYLFQEQDFTPFCPQAGLKSCNRNDLLETLALLTLGW